ncbi:TOBE domain-containing protein [Streptomyces sp. APSN-46.1]|uniref:TOBE domain-containing protein n=1 Tax=Streptomyces sp. APSN-46.1 TaxID=2929049 RepID=UPI001FB1D15F|nr:TOBE domain-containing protein [Streptomyces sp. APSN-46.1]MCJ1678819.1 TOBE domain-containing protein [Streptomyces sp. APSN-46.1]
MSLSIRNQIAGTVTSVTSGEAMTVVKVRLEGGQDITAAITTDAVKDLGIAEGSSVKALVKATEVALATGPVEGVSIRNQLAGTVAEVAVGPAMASVKVDVSGGGLTAAVTREAVDALGLAAGSSVVALIKATEISLATV